jgi:phosphate acetyltransferase
MDEFLINMMGKARKNPKRIVFPEAYNVDILRTARGVVENGMGTPVLIGVEEEIVKIAGKNQIEVNGFTFFDHNNEENRLNLAAQYVKEFTDFTEKAVIRKTKDEVRCAMFLVKLGKADCVAAGKEYSTGDVIFEAISIIGLKEGVESVSSLGIAEINGFEGSQGSMLGLADCAITAQPDAKDLAGIAISSADTASSLLGWEPRVAMLAFSTCGSSEHESIEVIKEAIDIVRDIRPEIKIDGEFQLDTAIIPAVASKKVNRESDVAGRANILIFPNLHAGNIGVKMIQIFGKANAYGPVLQGFSRPVCDFSRSAPVDEMLGNVAMLVIRAGV